MATFRIDDGFVAAYQNANNALIALDALMRAFDINVAPIPAVAWLRGGGAADPLAVHRTSGNRALEDAE
jgi:L-rhamnose isomerase/sugar isomerase